MVAEKSESVEVKLGDLLRKKKFLLSTAESCTGGGIASRITSIPGSSDYFMGAVVAYSNEIKINLLHVDALMLEKQGAVSEETVVQMVRGAMETLKTDCAVATSGVAGPGGGTQEKPVGTVWIAAACGQEIRTLKLEGDEGREMNIKRAIDRSLLLLYELLK